ncbi:SEL1-like repeat protein [Puniceibacterium confluentis]|uniref:SEL1-like repeat protein n=1 Tax=Puniceibacterium confluentis TaxID=1958944 RepID=UPI0011B6CD69|nr:SEL1-like repeat protein [Puniceibacterium confluentis]
MRTQGLAVLALLLALLPAVSVAQDADISSLTGAAESGDTAAQITLAQRYHDGDGVVQNFARAADWFARAAEAGVAEAQNRLGRYYHSGLGVQADRAAALRWLGAAADQGAPQHLYDLAGVLEEARDDPQTLTRAAGLYERAAGAGHTGAAVSLGVMYQNGTGVAQDPDRARALYEPAAAAGDARALNNLGLLYVRGSGVPQDYTRAAQLFAAAAEQGLAQAITNLGVMYDNGYGVPQDDAEAARLYRLGSAGAPVAETGFAYDPRLAPPPSEPAARDALRAAARAGDPVAEFQLGWLLVQGTEPTPEDWQQAAALFGRAAAKGHAASMAGLGLLYMRGRGVPQDYVLAQMWLVLAGSAGLDSAPALSAALQARMTSGQINEAQALAEARWAQAVPGAPASAPTPSP